MRPDFKTLLPEIWLTRDWRSNLLLPFTWVYGALVHLRRTAYRLGLMPTEQMPVPVVVIGNAVAGGGGKTPLTMAIVMHLQSAGWQVGVISRGYGRDSEEVHEVRPGDAPELAGDEPLMIRNRCHAPVFVAAQRVQAAKALLHAYPQIQIIVCDDGLQHYALQRDLEICAMDSRGIGNGRLLPAGPLREPWPRAVDLLIHTGQRSLPEGFTATRQLTHTLNAQGENKSIHDLAGQAVNAVAAIAQPQAFFDMLSANGIQLAQTFALPDHDSFAHWSPPSDALPLLCTEKDAHKLWPHCPQALAVPLAFEPEDAFWQALDARLQALHRRMPR
jgi:tetraacyldisaccharide 4'-kinase